MNTEVRRALFVAIMGADDYKEAHSRVGALRLKKAQLPEVARVLLDCCAQEGAFNPFYALLGAELTTKLRRYFIKRAALNRSDREHELILMLSPMLRARRGGR